MKKLNLLIYFFFSFNSIGLYSLDYSIECSEFAQSFSDHYDFSAEGRYTHEYHPALLKKTQESLKDLESFLFKNGFNLEGHQVILGYEGNAIPSYYSDYKKSKINDEASSHFREGWSLRLHNRFGLMTGFLFKDINESFRKYLGGDPFIKHINPDSVEIFDDEGEILLKHSFGNALPLLFGYKSYVESDIRSKNIKQLLEDLIEFWQLLYKNDVKSFNGGSAATSDILFSIEYAKYLSASSSPIKKFYVGGDITYPIETFLGQSKEATKNAQDFVKDFAPTLNSVNDENTAYIFCSFVDGVGKSTMLGNIQNWMDYKDNIDNYKRVDNSSSQYANIFQFKDKVFIADLPAQISHFTYKPDGSVYVPINSEKSVNEIEKVKDYVAAENENLKEKFLTLYNELAPKIIKNGYFIPEVTDSTKPENAFIRNLILLKKQETNTWVPFEFEDNHYLFNYFNPTEIRIFRELSSAPSSGLKNIESEQMLFFEGVRFPFSYSFFLDDLIYKLKKHEIKNVVMVNFVSMYPRSSRENIRINYLIQQFALINNHFNVDESLYKNFISPAQLYAQLLSSNVSKRIFNSFIDEVIIRSILFKFLLSRHENSLKGIPIKELTSLILQEMKLLRSNGFEKYVVEISEKKLKNEFQRLKNTFGLTRELINIQLFSFAPLVEFSKELIKIFTEKVNSQHLNSLWDGLNGKIYEEGSVYLGESDRIVKLDDGTEVLSKFEFYPECKELNALSPFLKYLRVVYYSAICNFLYSETNEGDSIINIPQVKYASLPNIITSNQNGHVYCIQKKIGPIEGNENFKPETKFGISLSYQVSQGIFDNRPYVINFENKGTSYGLFAFDSTLDKKKKFILEMKSPVTEIISEYKNKEGQDKCMPASKLYVELMRSEKWARERQLLFDEAKKNGEFPINDSLKLTLGKKEKNGYVGTFTGLSTQKEGVRLCIRSLATLEMILKDPNSDICVRKGNKKDFIAAIKLLEEVVIPKYFGILFAEPLFDNYDSIEPIIPWEECNK